VVKAAWGVWMMEDEKGTKRSRVVLLPLLTMGIVKPWTCTAAGEKKCPRLEEGVPGGERK